MHDDLSDTSNLLVCVVLMLFPFVGFACEASRHRDRKLMTEVTDIFVVFDASVGHYSGKVCLGRALPWQLPWQA